ncbi:MAG: TonB-dependent receptor [Rhizomicrobium sp.]
MNVLRFCANGSAFVFTLGAALTVGADAAALESSPIETVVVSASAMAQKLEDAPASISVVSSEDLQRQPVMDVTEALQRVEGVSLSHSGNQLLVQMRGLSSAYTLIMVDGKRVSSTSSMFRGNDFDASWLPVEAIERVEVVRGPMSSLYGSDAMGGVINIITKPVGDAWNASVSGSYTAQQDRDAGDSYKMDSFISGPLVDGKLGLKMWAGYDRRLADGKVNSSGQDGFPDRHEAFANGSLVYTPDNQTRIEGGAGFTQSNHDGFVMDRRDFSVSANRDFGWASGTLRLYGDRIHNAVGNITSEIHPNTSSNTVMEGRFTVPLADWRQAIAFGGDYRRQTLHDAYLLTGLPGTSSYGTDPYTSVGQWSLFAEDDVTITQSLHLTLGDRYDHHDKFGGHHSPRAYLVWHALPELTFKGGWSRAFRAATLLQLSPNWGSVSCGSATTGCYIIGSAELKPETSTSYEFGTEFHIGSVSAGVTLFQNTLKNMIDISRTNNRTLAPTYSNFAGFLADGRPIFEYYNIAKMRSRGIEAHADAPLTDTISLHVNYTYIDSRNLATTPPIAMTYQPNHTINTRMDWQVGNDLSFYAASRFLGKQYLSVSTSSAVTRGSYALFDMGGRYDILDKTTLRAGVLNVLDRTISRDVSGEYNEDGRRFFVSLTQRI